MYDRFNTLKASDYQVCYWVITMNYYRRKDKYTSTFIREDNELKSISMLIRRNTIYCLRQ